MRKNRELKISFPKEEKKKKLSITTLIIVLGTIVGIYIGIDKIYYNRVIFGFKPDGIVCGSFPEKKIGKQFIILFGTATNEGNKPLHPAHFDLKIKIKDKWISLLKSTIPEDDVFARAKNKTQNFEIKDAAKNDLQAWKRPITVEEPACGNLMFLSDELDFKSMEDSNNITFELTCVDIYGKKYKFTTIYRYGTDFKTPVKLIKHNVKFGPKKEQK